jgi:hypothetical protein
MMNKDIYWNNKQPTYKRQRFLLAFIHQLQAEVTSTDLQKLIFLHMMRENLGYYEFIPYKFGPYSFQLAEDLDVLREGEYLSIKSNRIKAIGKCRQEALFGIASERGGNLVRKALPQCSAESIHHSRGVLSAHAIP